MELKGHVLITGAAKRIARVIAESLLDYEISLTAHYYRSEKEAKELEKLAIAKGRPIHLMSADLRNTDINALVKTAEKALGPVTVLINSASSFYSTRECKESEWDDLLSINLKAPFFLSQACARSMKKTDGVIINISDTNVLRTLPDHTPYLVSKSGLLMLTQNLAKQWAPNIRVNAISPGPVLLPEHYTEEQKKISIERTLLKQSIPPEHIAQAIKFLIQNDYLTGFNLIVDGGRHLL